MEQVEQNWTDKGGVRKKRALREVLKTSSLIHREESEGIVGHGGTVILAVIVRDSHTKKRIEGNLRLEVRPSPCGTSLTIMIPGQRTMSFTPGTDRRRRSELYNNLYVSESTVRSGGLSCRRKFVLGSIKHTYNLKKKN